MKKINIVLFLIIITCAALSAEAHATVNDDKVRIRTAPSVKYSKILTAVNRGTKLEVYSKTEESDCIDGLSFPWYEVSCSNSVSGWIFGAYIDVVITDDDYIRTDEKADAFAQAFYDELYEIYFTEEPTLSKAAFNKLFGGRRVVKSDSADINCGDGTHGIMTFDTYEIDGCFITMTNWDEWSSSEFTRTVPNSFSVKIGMTRRELEKVFGSPIKTFYWTYLFGDEATLKFKFSNDILESIYIDHNFMSGV